MREGFPDPSSPVRANIEFFIKLRNKIEYRYEQLLVTAIAGKTQAHVLNFEETLTAWFSTRESLGDSLRFPVFMSSLTPDAVKALKETDRKLPKRLVKFIREQDASLPGEVAEDWRYDFRVLLLPQTGPKSESDAVMRFVREEEMTAEQRQARDVVQTIVRHRIVPVKNRGLHKPGAAAKLVSKDLGVRFTNFGDHVAAWHHYGVRPDKNAARPELTDDRYCVYDEVHADYLYTDAWVKKLVKDLTDPVALERVTGHAPQPL